MYKICQMRIISHYCKFGLLLVWLMAGLLAACSSAPTSEVGQQSTSAAQSSPTETATTQVAPSPSPQPTPTATVVAATPTLSQPADISPESPVALPGTTPDPGQVEPDGRAAVFPNTIIVYQREGGPPDSPQEWTFYYTGLIKAADGTERQLPATRVEQVFDLAESSDLWRLDDNYAPAGQCLDCLVQTLTIYRQGEIKEISVTGDPPELPEDLKQILSQIEALVS